MKDARLTLPNVLTVGRLVMVPFVVYFLAQGDFAMAFWLFAVAAATDLFDGKLARLLNQRSEFGAWLDPIADKAMLLSSLAMLTWLGVLPLWLMLLIGARDLLVLVGAATYRALTGSLEVAPTWWGKTATAVEFVLVSMALAHQAYGLAGSLLQLMIVPAGLLAFASGAHYVWLWSAKKRAWDAGREGS